MADTKDRHVYINVTEIRGMPLIIIEAYQALFILVILLFLRWMVFAIEHTCKRHHREEIADAIATAHPVRRWLSETFSPTTRGSASYFSDESSIESKEDEPPTAAEILPAVAPETLPIEGRRSEV